MHIADLPTPCLLLERSILQRNLDRMAHTVAHLGVALRPNLKTAKSIDVARLALAANGTRATGITVSTLAEAEYFSAHGIADIFYAVGITRQKLDQVAKLNRTGAAVIVVTDDLDIAEAIANHPAAPRALIEIECGDGRGGITAASDRLTAVAARLGPALGGVMTHASQAYGARSMAEAARFAEIERAAAVAAAERLRGLGHPCPIVSVGCTPAVRAAMQLDGVTEVRAGVHMFGDLFQAATGMQGLGDIAMTVLTSVVGRREEEHRLIVDAGSIALSMDRSTVATAHDYGFGLVLDAAGGNSLGCSVVGRVNQEHGIITLDPTLDPLAFRIGDRLRIAPNHACLTAAAHDRYFVVDGDDTVLAVWPRVNGW
jgi:D-serine deaminase-like pyridoxal phosphate-dependent protein